jgi:cytochrome subunit of sulfide dehydrogenase
MNIFLIFLIAFFSSFNALAQTPNAIKQDFQAVIWALSCTSCHGTDGKAEGVGLHIAGRKPDELHKMLLDYKSGKRQGTIMHQHAKGYSDSELKRIAIYFSEVK